MKRLSTFCLILALALSVPVFVSAQSRRDTGSGGKIDYSKTGLAAVAGDQTVSGALTVTGAVTLQTTLGVTGATSLGNTLTLDDGSGASPSLVLTDGSTESATFSKVDSGYLTITTLAADGVSVRTGNLTVGNGTAGTAAMDGEDFYCEGQSEFDGTAQFDGAVTCAANLTVNNTAGGTFNIGTDNTTADTIAIGSAKDTSSLAGIAVTVGSTGTTSATTVQSGTGDLALTSTDDITLTVATAATDNIVLTANTSTEATAISLSATAGTVKIAGDKLDVDTTDDMGFLLTTNADGEDLTIGLTGNQNSSILIDSAGSGTDALSLTTSTNGGDIVISSNDKIDMDSVGTFALNAAGDTLLIQVDADGAADDLTLKVAGNQNSSLILDSEGSGTDAVSITTSTNGGDIIIDSNDNLGIGITTGGQDITIGNATGATSVTVNAGSGNIAVGGAVGATHTYGAAAQTGTMKFAESSATMETDIATGTGTHTVHIADGAAPNAVTLGSSNTTATTAIQGGTSISVAGAAGTTITVGKADQTGTMKFGESSGTVEVDVGTGVGAHAIHIGDGGTAAQVVTIGSTSAASGVTIQSGTADVTITSADDFIFTATDDISFSSNSAGGVIGIGDGNDGYTINVGTDNTAVDTITVGSAADTVAVAGATIGLTGATTVTGTLAVTTPTTMEYLLSSTASVDVGAATEYHLYTVPAGKNCVITKIVIRGASGTFDQAQDPQFSFGFNHGTSNDVIANATYTAPTTSAKYLAIVADGKTSATESTRGQAAEVFAVKVNTTATAPTTCTIDTFGYLY